MSPQPRKKAGPSNSGRSVPPGKVADLLRRLAAVDGLDNGPEVEAARKRLEAEAAAKGLGLVAIEITGEAMPDPALEALTRGERDQLVKIGMSMGKNPAQLIAPLEKLVAKYPHIPVLRNQLAAALGRSGRTEEAQAIVEKLVVEFPAYIFGVSNLVLCLLREGRVDEAGALIETGPRGSLLALTQFFPGRTKLHESEVRSHAEMAGSYLAITGRLEMAIEHLKMLEQLDPDGSAAQRVSQLITLRALEEADAGAPTRAPASGWRARPRRK